MIAQTLPATLTSSSMYADRDTGMRQTGPPVVNPMLPQPCILISPRWPLGGWEAQPQYRALCHQLDGQLQLSGAACDPRAGPRLAMPLLLHVVKVTTNDLTNEHGACMQ